MIVRNRQLLLGAMPLLGMAASVLAIPAAHALSVSASNNAAGCPSSCYYDNTLGLPPKPAILVPKIPADFPASPVSLMAPGSGTNTQSVNFNYGNTTSGALHFNGTAMSSITNMGSGYNIGLTLTNFLLGSNGTVNHEYYYLNIWETFTNLVFPSANWPGSASIVGFSNRTSLGDGLFIEPIVTVLNGTSWTAASTFFGGMPAGLAGPINASTAVNPLTPSIAGGNLTVGFEVILGLNNIDGIAGDAIILPSSLHLSLQSTPVPGPLPAVGAVVAWNSSRRIRRRLRQASVG